MRTLVEWVTQFVAFEHILDGRYEFVMNLFIHIYPFDATATLAGVEDCAIYNLFCNPFNVDVRSHICRILASELKAYTKRNTIVRSALNRKAIGYGTSKANELNLGRSCYGLDLYNRATMEDLEHTIRETSFFENLLDLLGTGWRLWGRLQNHRVACEQGRY